jgi:hypothetical protein
VRFVQLTLWHEGDTEAATVTVPDTRPRLHFARILLQGIASSVGEVNAPLASVRRASSAGAKSPVKTQRPASVAVLSSVAVTAPGRGHQSTAEAGANAASPVTSPAQPPSRRQVRRVDGDLFAFLKEK